MEEKHVFNSENLSLLNDLEYDLYNYIISHREEVVSMTIRDLATIAHVSPTSILRFCKKLNFQGYAEFKLYLKMSMDKNETIEYRNNTESVLEYFKMINNNEFNEAIDLAASYICKVHSVIFLGIGTSGILANYAARYFSNVGKFALAIDDPFFPVRVESEAVIVVLSVSGETKELINTINQMKNENCYIISITNSSKNTISKISDLNINYHLPEDVLQDHVNLTTQVPVIHIIESIAKNITNI